MRISRAVPALLVALTAAFPPVDLGAQERIRAVVPSTWSHGWLGIEIGPADPGEEAGVPIATVVAESPAYEAGLRAGDRIIRIDDRPASVDRLRWLAARLEPGAETRLVVERSGESRTVTVEAAERPLTISIDGVPVTLDSLETQVRLRLDSMQISPSRFSLRTDTIRTGRGLQGVVVREAPRVALRGDTIQVRREIRLDTLLAELGRARVGTDTPVRVIEGVRLRPDSARWVTQEVRIGRDSATWWPTQEVRIRPDSARWAMEGVPIRSDSGTWVARPVRIPDSPLVELADSARTVRIRTGAPGEGARRLEAIDAVALTGRRAVAGAEFTPLNPGLARYFGVEDGVLTVNVVDGSPAHDAGLRAGDVVVRVDDRPVTEVDELRVALSRGYRSPPVPVEIVREGTELILQFSR